MAVTTRSRHRHLNGSNGNRLGLRIAAIDVGSNSVHMIVAEADRDGSITTLWRMKEMVGLGQATFPARRLSKHTMSHVVAAVARCHDEALAHGCEQVLAVATSAVREAANGGELISRIRRRVGLDVRVISGREEARLIYLGVRHVDPLGGGPHLIMDIGGGSVEVIVASGKRLLLLDSRKLGAARLTAAFVRSDPINEQDRAALAEHFERELAPLTEAVLSLKPVRAIGTSGTFENLAALASHASGPMNGGERPGLIDRSAFNLVLDRLIGSTSEERAAMPGLDPGRRDQIVAGALLVSELLRRFKLRRIEISRGALREGILIDYLERHLPELSIQQQVPDQRRRSVLALARRCAWHKAHSEQVARLCMQLFDQLKAVHHLDNQDRDLIEAAALLHDIGWHISPKKHHKHSQYLILNGDLKGYTPEQISIIANISRYHRKSPPSKAHDAYAELSSHGRRVVDVGAALLRVADGLDRSHGQVIRGLTCRVREKEVRCELDSRSDAQLELWGANRKRELFEQVFGRPLSLHLARRQNAGS